MRNKILLAAIAAATALTMTTPATAREGCGAGYHRGPAGRCRANVNGNRVIVAPGRLIIGNFYKGRGYWDGRRYYQQRYRHHNGWRYR